MLNITVISTKGGVGKTSTAANVGALLADLGARVLLVDADPHASLSKYFPLAAEPKGGLLEVITQGTVSECCVTPTKFENLSIVLSNDQERKIDSFLPGRIDRAARMKLALKNDYTQENFDVCIIDTQGAQSALQESAAFAADVMLSPIIPDVLSAREFVSGTVEMLERMNLGRAIGLTPAPMHAFINRMDNTKNAKNIVSVINKSFLEMDGKVRMMNTIIRNSKAYTESATAMIPVHCSEINTNNKSESAYVTMHRLVWELIPSLKDTRATCFGNLDEKEIPVVEQWEDDNV